VHLLRPLISSPVEAQVQDLEEDTDVVSDIPEINACIPGGVHTIVN
jgi:hypothetical protein